MGFGEGSGGEAVAVVVVGRAGEGLTTRPGAFIEVCAVNGRGYGVISGGRWGGEGEGEFVEF